MRGNERTLGRIFFWGSEPIIWVIDTLRKEEFMDEILTRKEAAKEYKIPLGTMDYLVGTNQIPYSRIGKRNVRFSRERLQRWFREREGVEYRKRKVGESS